MTTLLDGKRIAEGLYEQLRARAGAQGISPLIDAVLVGDSPASLAFLRVKEKAAASVGARFRLHRYDSDISLSELSREMNRLAKGSGDALIVQLPLPAGLDKARQSILRIIPPEKDADCLSEIWQGKIISGRTTIVGPGGNAELVPPVVGAVLRIADEYGFDLSGKRIAVVGWGDLVGKPLVPYLIRRGAEVTICTSKTRDLTDTLRRADAIISGAGVPQLINGSMIKRGVFIFDAGYNKKNGTLVGDVDINSVLGVADAITPVPGGIGPLTVACLLYNAFTLAAAHHKSSGTR